MTDRRLSHRAIGNSIRTTGRSSAPILRTIIAQRSTKLPTPVPPHDQASALGMLPGASTTKTHNQRSPTRLDRPRPPGGRTHRLVSDPNRRPGTDRGIRNYGGSGRKDRELAASGQHGKGLVKRAPNQFDQQPPAWTHQQFHTGCFGQQRARRSVSHQ